MSRPWPTELRVRRSENTLSIRFDNGEAFVLPAEYLRVMTGSALDKGHGEARAPVAGKAGVGIAEITPIGRYAVRIRFDDGHDTGLYSWDALHELGAEQPSRWGRYLAELDRRGLSR
jgi:DUF971 family protein